MVNGQSVKRGSKNKCGPGAGDDENIVSLNSGLMCHSV